MEGICRKAARLFRDTIIFDSMNRKSLILVLSAILGLTQFHAVSAQDYVAPPVTISKEKIRMDGRTFYSHIVLEKQTLYSISKAYGVTVEQIYEANPSLRETGLKKNSIILIPTYDGEKTAKEIRQEQKETEKQQKREEKQRRQDEKKNFLIHTVKWYEDLDVIAAKYGVSVGSIMEANGLTGRKLSNRQKLRIPIGPAQEPEVPQIPEEDAQHQEQQVPATIKEESMEHNETVTYTGKKEIDAVLLLPLNASGEKKSESAMDFYSGALLAAKELGEKGINIEISTYDAGEGNLPVTRERLMRADVVIGPFASQDIEALLAKAPESTYVVSPLDHRAERFAGTYRNFIQVPSSTEAQYADIVDWIEEEMSPSDAVVIVHEKSLKGDEEAKNLKARLNADGIAYTTFSYSILEGRDIVGTIAEKISEQNTNRVIVASDSEAFANDVIRNFNLLLHNRYPVVLYCNSKIRSYETADIGNLHNVGTRVSMSYYVDYDSPDVQNFLLKYRALYNTEPTAFAYQGYDTMTYFVNICAEYGTSWPSMLTKEETRMLQSNFGFTKKADGGYVNTATRRIIYNPDYSVTEVK